jgi:hypothetical protein
MSTEMSMNQAIEVACKQLQREYGEEPILSRVIRAAVEALRGQKPGAGLPADGCYNRFNAPRFEDNNPCFEYVSRGYYKYLGFDYPYTGEVRYKPMGGVEQVVGRWQRGKFVPK